MPHQTSAKLADFAQSTADDALRTIVIVYESDCELIHLRDDLRDRYTAEEYKAVVDTFKEIPELTNDITRDSPLGSKQSLIHHHEKAFVFQFPHEGCHSILLSVDPTVGSRLRSFINGCQQQL
ncbi:hypothetical protein [Haloarcula sp. JP-L23]|uniref:hypothetical protein n=1 Tax=Haloarcula sp. JP-L23 TaxID=2716717 RepID=UPI00140EE9EE|nr:hypothetical protein G9465_24315 [Haloarcula sp. JP-L23]